MRLFSYSRSTASKIHPYQDAILVDDVRRLYAVFDGVTKPSQGYGDIGADLAKELLAKNFNGEIKLAVEKVDKLFRELMRSDKTIGETTLTAAHIKDGKVEVANLGDSYACIVNKKSFNILNELHERTSGGLTKCVGYGDGEAFYKSVDMKENDYLVLATDGIEEIIEDYSDFLIDVLSGRGTGKEKINKIFAKSANVREKYDDDRSIIIVHNSL